MRLRRRLLGALATGLAIATWWRAELRLQGRECAPQRAAYVTLLCDDEILDAVAALAHSLRTVLTESRPLIVLVPPRGEGPSEATRRLLAAIPHAATVEAPVPPFTNATEWDRVYRRPCRFAKLHAWSLIQYGSAVYLDADTLVVDPAQLADLLDRPHHPDWPAGHAIAAAPEVANSDLFNAGVILLRPDASTHAALLAALPKTRSYNKGDQGLLNVFFNPEGFGKPPEHGHSWVRLPQRYNVLITGHERHAWTVLAPRAVVLHYTSETKPWNFFRRGPLGSTPWRAAFDPSAWWLWKARSFAARKELGLLVPGEEERWQRTRPICASRFNIRHASAEADFAWPPPRRSGPPRAVDPAEERFAVLIPTFDRPLDQVALLVRHYAAHPLASSVHLLWLNNATLDLASSLPPGWPYNQTEIQHAPVSLVLSNTDHLMDRLLPPPGLRTHAVFTADDDIVVSHDGMTTAFRAWQLDRDRIAGFFPRVHLRGSGGAPEYGLGRRLLANGYSIVLTKAAFLHADYLWLASCALPHSVTTIVGEEGGCEDIAAAFLASGTSGKPPLLVHPGSGTVQCGERVPHELGSGDSAVARGEGWACWRAHAIEDYGYHSGLSGRAKHAPGRSRCLAAFEGIFGDVLKVSTEAVTGHGGWPPFLGRRDAGDLANSALLRG